MLSGSVINAGSEMPLCQHSVRLFSPRTRPVKHTEGRVTGGGGGGGGSSALSDTGSRLSFVPSELTPCRPADSEPAN